MEPAFVVRSRTLSGDPILGNVDLHVLDGVLVEPVPGVSAVCAVWRAIHDDLCGGCGLLVGGFARFGLRIPRRCSLRLKGFDLRKEDLVVGLVLDVVYVDVADAAVSVDQEDGSLGDAFVLAEDAPRARDLAVRPEVGSQWIGDAFKAFGPSGQAVDVIDAYTQDLGVECLEPGELRLVRGDLAGSNRRPCERVEDHDDVLSTHRRKVEFSS